MCSPHVAIKRAPAGTALCNENTQGRTRRWAFGSGSRRRDAGSKREQNAEFNWILPCYLRPSGPLNCHQRPQGYDLLLRVTDMFLWF